MSDRVFPMDGQTHAARVGSDRTYAE
jgi:hypothetical protein